MSDLVAAMIAAGGPGCTDARDHRTLHAALVRLGEATAGSPSLPAMSRRPDPDVGLRVEGVTRAVWALVASGLLQVRERAGGATLVVACDALPEARRILMLLPDRDRTAIYAAADFWARSSTARKKSASAPTSPGAARLAREAKARQSVPLSRRQRAVKESCPA